MLTSRSRWSHAACSIESTLAITDRIRVHAARRHRLSFDSRFVRAFSRGRPLVSLLFLIEGDFIVEGFDRSPLDVVWFASEPEFDTREHDARWFRSAGTTPTLVHFSIERALVCVDRSLADGPIALSSRACDAMRALIDGDIERATIDLVTAAVEQNLLQPETLASLHAPETPEMLRLWSAFAGAHARHDSSVQRIDVGGLIGMSPRQIDRGLRELAGRLGLDSFRSTIRAVRLRRAVLLLSAEGLSVQQVAEIVGYRSVDAMGRAFRDEGLPPPSFVQSALRADPRLVSRTGHHIAPR